MKSALAVLHVDERFESVIPNMETFSIQVAQGEHNQTIFLGTIFDELREVPPEDRAERVRAFIDVLFDTQEISDDWEEVRPLIRCVVRPSSYLGAVRLNAKAVVFRQVAPFLLESLVIDYPGKMATVTTAQLEKWKVDAARAFRAGRENLEELGAAVGPYDDKDSPIRCVVNDDCYEAARLVAPSFLLALAKTLPGRPIVAIPHRSLLVVTDDSEDSRVLRLAEIARREYEAAPRSISPGLYTITDDGTCVPYVRQGRDAVANAVALGHHVLALSEYADQKNRIEKALEEQGIDVFVASYSVIRAKTDDHSFSYAAWPPVDTLLPRVDFVALNIDERDVFVPWSIAERLAVDGWEPCPVGWQTHPELEPPRVRATHYPSPDVLQQLRAASVDPCE